MVKTEVVLNKHTCASHGCGITFWLEEGFEARRIADKQIFFCPSGHTLSYRGETDADKVIRITREKNAEIARLQGELSKKCKKKIK